MSRTHDVLNQPPPLEDYNLYLTDPVLDRAIAAEGGKESRDTLVRFGERVGSAEVFEWGFLANTNDPVLKTHDRYGNRIDEVEFHPSWHSLMDLAVSNGLHSIPWEEDGGDGGQLTRTALLYMSSQVEAGHFCPISMTTAAVPALRATPSIASEWVPRIVRRSYDPSFRPSAGEVRHSDGHGDDRETGRIRCQVEHHDGCAAQRWRARRGIFNNGTQMVHLCTDV
jgi:putative acyl-CoA dehydrogenase